jgi:hypothetical protein
MHVFLVKLLKRTAFRGDVHIQVARQNVKLTFWVGGWVKTVVL